MTGKELLWIRNILSSIRVCFKTHIIVFEDNQPCIELAENAMSSKRSRHIDMKHQWLRYYMDNGFFKFYCHTKLQKADGMTEPLPKGSFAEFRDVVSADTV